MTSGVSAKGYTSTFEDSLASQRQDITVGSSPGLLSMAEIGQERAGSLGRNAEFLPISARESNILFVNGLPTDCTRREVGRILARYALAFVNTSSLFPTLLIFTALSCLVCRLHPIGFVLQLILKTSIVVFITSLQSKKDCKLQ